MTLRAVMLTYSRTAPLRMTFLVVSSIVPLILVAGLVRLVAETFLSLVESVVRQLLFHFSFEIAFFPYAAIMM